MLKTLRLTFLLLSVCCFNAALLAQAPANDNCADAVVVTLDESVAFTTIDATRDGPFHMDSPCPSSTSDTIFADVWFSFTSPLTGEVTWSMCGMADFDSRIAVYVPGASCPPEAEDLLDCNEDGPADCINSESEITFDVEEGMTYLLRLGGFGNEDGTFATGSGTFTITQFIFNGPPNSFCDGAEAIDLGTHEFDTQESITDGPDHPDDPACFGFGSVTIFNDIWYTYTPNFTGSVEWSTCEMITFDSRLAVYGPNVACPVTPDDLYACNDDGNNEAGEACTGFSSKLIFDVEEGQTYLLRLGGFGTDSGFGTFTLNEIIPPTPPVNDLCENAGEAIVITQEQADNFDIIHEGTTMDGSFDGSTFIFPNCLGNQAGGEFSDVWFKFNTLGNTELQIRANATTPGAIFYVDVWPSCGEEVLDTTIINGACVNVGGTALTFDSDTLTGLPAEDIELYVRVITRLTSDPTGEFWIQVVGDIVSGIAPVLELEDFNFYPNPVSQTATVNFGLSTAAHVDLEIHNAIGQLIYAENKGRMIAGQQTMQLDMNDLQNGLYFLTIRGDGKEHVSRFVKQ